MCVRNVSRIVVLVLIDSYLCRSKRVLGHTAKTQLRTQPRILRVFFLTYVVVIIIYFKLVLLRSNTEYEYDVLVPSS